MFSRNGYTMPNAINERLHRIKIKILKEGLKSLTEKELLDFVSKKIVYRGIGPEKPFDCVCNKEIQISAQTKPIRSYSDEQIAAEPTFEDEREDFDLYDCYCN